MGRQVIDIRKDGEKVYVKNHAKVTFLSDGTNVEQRIIDVSNDLSTKVNKDYIDDILENIIIDSSQIDFNQLQNNPFADNNSGKLEVTDESGNIIAKIDAEGIHSVDFIAGNHKLTDKIDSSALNGYAKESWVTAEITKAATEGKVDLTGYATEEYVNNIDFYNINNNPIVNNGDGKLLFVDENGYIGLQLEEDGLYVKDVIADGHTLSQKADKSDIPSLDGYATESYVNTNLQNYATKDEVSDLVDMSVVTELQGKVNTLIDTDADKSVRDIAVDVLTETLVSETATEAYDTLAEMSAWIKSHPEDAAAMNTAIQKNATDITNLDAAYKAADAKVLTDAQEYTDNINFYTIKDNPIVDGEAGSITFVDETGYIGLKVTEDGIIAKDVVTPEHTLSSKADKSFVEDNYYNKSTVDKKITEAVTGGQVSLDGFATEQWVNEQGFLKDHQDISHLAEKSELPTKVSDLENDSKFITIEDVPVLEIPEEYVTETELNDKGFLTEHQDISHLASKDDVYDSISNIDFYSIKDNPVLNTEDGKLLFVDESGNIGLQLENDRLYVSDVVAGDHILSNKADIDDIPSLDGYAKTEDIPSLDGLVKEENLPNFDEFAKTEDIPSLDGLVKSEDLPNFDEFAKTEDIPSLDGYAKTEDIPSLDGYASKEWVNNKNYATEDDLNNIDYSSINNVPVSEDETGELNITDENGNIGMKIASEAVYAKDFVASEHKLSEKADKTYVDNSIEEIKNSSSDANVQAVDTGDVIDDVTVDYATKTYVDGLVGNINSTLGNINSVLENIING